MFESDNFFYGGFALVDVAEELCISETNVFLWEGVDMYFTFFIILLYLQPLRINDFQFF